LSWPTYHYAFFRQIAVTNAASSLNPAPLPRAFRPHPRCQFRFGAADQKAALKLGENMMLMKPTSVTTSTIVGASNEALRIGRGSTVSAVTQYVEVDAQHDRQGRVQCHPRPLWTRNPRASNGPSGMSNPLT
jgi:hypothetical protein